MLCRREGRGGLEGLPWGGLTAHPAHSSGQAAAGTALALARPAVLRDPRPTQGRLAFLRGLDVQGGDLGFLWVSGGPSRGPSYTCGQHTAGSGPRAGEGTDRHKGLDAKTPWILGVTRATPPIRAFLLLGMGLVGLEIRSGHGVLRERDLPLSGWMDHIFNYLILT